MPAIYKGEDVRIEVKLPKAFSNYSEVKAHVIFPLPTSGALGVMITAGVTGVTLDGTQATNNLPVAVFGIGNALTKIADDATGGASRLLSNTSGVLEVRLKEGTGTTALFKILSVPIGPVIDTKIKSLA